MDSPEGCPPELAAQARSGETPAEGQAVRVSAWGREGARGPGTPHTAGCRLEPGPAEPAVSSSKNDDGVQPLSPFFPFPS